MAGSGHEAFQALVTTALLGTARGECVLPPLGGKISALLEQLPAEPVEQRLLASAGIVSLCQRAGWRPAARAGPALPPAPEDQFPPCNRRAASHLRRVLEIGLRDVLRDWCRAAAATGCRAPDELLPALLNLMRAGGNGALVQDIAAVLGTRGRWLSSLNPEWAAALSADDNWESRWETGSKAERMTALRELRRCEPARARERVQSTWAQEEPDCRVAILEVLRLHLSLEDEPLLVAALADKRKPVRVAAADLLARLPASSYCQRLADHTSSFVQVERKRGLLGRRKLALTVTIPPEDLKLSHEAIEARASGDIGPRAMMLAHMIAATPLALWTQAAEGAGPADILEAARDSEWRDVLILGWTQAAARQADAAWAEPLARNCLESDSEKNIERLRAHLDGLMDSLAPPAREAVATAALGRNKDASFPLAWQAVTACEHSWSSAFSRHVLKVLAARFEASNDWYEPWMTREACGWLAVHLDSAVIDETVTRWSKRIPSWRPAVQRFADELLDLLQLRRAYLKELSP